MKRLYITLFLIGGLYICFAGISILVIITRRNSWFVQKKLRIGALLLSLSGISAGCTQQTISCYDVVVDYITIDTKYLNSETGEIIVPVSSTYKLSGTIEYRFRDVYSYAVFDQYDSLLAKGNLSAQDGAFDEEAEDFEILIESGIGSGSYVLRFYDSPSDSIENPDWYNQSYKLRVIE